MRSANVKPSHYIYYTLHPVCAVDAVVWGQHETVNRKLKSEIKGVSSGDWAAC